MKKLVATLTAGLALAVPAVAGAHPSPAVNIQTHFGHLGWHSWTHYGHAYRVWVMAGMTECDLNTRHPLTITGVYNARTHRRVVLRWNRAHDAVSGGGVYWDGWCYSTSRQNVNVYGRIS